jgi:hypothetical protein
MAKRLAFIGLLFLVAVMSTSAAIAITSGLSDTSPPSQPDTEHFADVAGQRLPVEIGSVVGRGSLEPTNAGPTCVLSDPIAVGAVAGEKSSGASVTWQFDDQCNAVVTALDAPPPPLADGTKTPASPPSKGGR